MPRPPSGDRKPMPLTYVLEMQDITKRFPGVLANDRVTLCVEAGTIHALVGENGAGKTTLMNILYGLYRPDSGRIILRGKPVTVQDPSHAISLGMSMVHQHFMLAPSLTVAENVVLGRTPTRAIFTDMRRAENLVREISARYGLAVDPQARVRELSVGIMQRVEIVKALYRGADILILDEPTAVLTPQETRELFTVLKTLSDQGKTIIFITHKLKEVMTVSKRVTVMRDGRVSGELETARTEEHELARLMVGRDVVLRVEKPPAQPGEPVLSVDGLCSLNDQGLPALRDVSFQVNRGEILGVAGVEGNGQTELAEVLTGLRPSTSGTMLYRGRDVTHVPPRRLREMGQAHIPEDRLKRGVSTQCTIKENLILTRYYRDPLSQKRILSQARVDEYARRLIDQYSIAAPEPELPISTLSGGNMQRVVLAREMAESPELLIAAQPTRGVDVAATEYIHNQIVALRSSGHAVLLISADLDEIMSLSDRIIVLEGGRIVGQVAAADASEEELGLLMAGISRPDRIQTQLQGRGLP